MKKSKSMKRKETKRAASETTLKMKRAVPAQESPAVPEMTLKANQSARKMAVKAKQEPPAVPEMTLKKYLWDRRIAQSYVSAELGCSTSTVCRKLAGKQEWSAGEVLMLSGLLSMSMNGVMDLINCKAKK